MGFGEWGGDTQQDIIEATEWAINQGIADPQKLEFMVVVSEGTLLQWLLW